MVTKGYRKGVYERVTKGINSRTGQLGQTRLYKEDRWSLVQTCYVEGSARQCNVPVQNGRNSWTKGNRDYDLDSNCTDGGSG
jgi:hypothetical protein